MSVTVEDLMMLPSLRQAKVIGGSGGMRRVVSSISVLESTKPETLVNELFPDARSGYSGGELVITGFINCTDDVEMQCENVRRLIEGGEVGLVLYYVGVYLPRVDQRLIDMADENDFVLICMPEGKSNLRYGELITDVTECIYQDKSSASLVSDILDRMSSAPRSQQTVATALRMLCMELGCSIVLGSMDGVLLELATWPSELEDTVRKGLEPYLPFPFERGSVRCQFMPDAVIVRCCGLNNTTDCRRAYLTVLDALEDVRNIFPDRCLVLQGELEFAAECRKLIDGGEDAAMRSLAPLTALKSDSESGDLLETVCTYLLDCDGSVTKTAGKLFLHRNTIKYRLQRITDMLGHHSAKMPEMMGLYRSAAVYRLLVASKET